MHVIQSIFDQDLSRQNTSTGGPADIKKSRKNIETHLDHDLVRGPSDARAAAWLKASERGKEEKWKERARRREHNTAIGGLMPPFFLRPQELGNGFFNQRQIH